jgi:hypothetical protein
MSRKDQLLRIIARARDHFAADDVSPADADHSRALQRHIERMRDGLDLTRIEFESCAFDRPGGTQFLDKRAWKQKNSLRGETSTPEAGGIWQCNRPI